MKIPVIGSTDFYSQLRTATELRWAALRVEERDGWQPSTRWTEGLTADQVASAEKLVRQDFPLEYKKFLMALGSTTPGQLVPSGSVDDPFRLVEAPGFLDWRTQQTDILERIADVVSGLWWDIEIDSATTEEDFRAVRERRDVIREPSSWPKHWGPCPPSTLARLEKVTSFVDEAPPLIPLIGNRYLVNLGTSDGPVLSVHQNDIVYWADSLQSFLLSELSDFLPSNAGAAHPLGNGCEIPFWSHFVRPFAP